MRSNIFSTILDPLPPCHCPCHATYQYCHHVFGNTPPPPQRDIIYGWSLMETLPPCLKNSAQLYINVSGRNTSNSMTYLMSFSREFVLIVSLLPFFCHASLNIKAFYNHDTVHDQTAENMNTCNTILVSSSSTQGYQITIN